MAGTARAHRRYHEAVVLMLSLSVFLHQTQIDILVNYKNDHGPGPFVSFDDKQVVSLSQVCYASTEAAWPIQMDGQI